MAETERYNGWKNYETWAVALWLDNEESSYNKAHRMARAAWRDAEADDHFTRDERAMLALSDGIKEWVEESNPCADRADLWADLMNAALSEVDWREVAEHYLSDVDRSDDAAPEDESDEDD
jgi:hypothetical protein